jgi:alkanesulfonate monooxygenase SsuD/methylene tetrahydromethanopterin reductase-like flavin-dependent oxidoreductase (luciferase family)
MPRVILQVYPSLGGPEEMAKRRPIGRDNEAVQAMLDSLPEVAQAADDLGYWAITHVEHHFHSEGLEYSPSPLLLNVWLSRYTKRLRHGQLGLVLTAHDPIRLAEEIAIADHLTKGRLIVGLARGYQSRWMSTLGQKFHVTATLSDQSEVDRRNRELFQENFRIMKMAWSDELLRYKGPSYEVPYPYDTGVPNWPPADAITRPYGVPGEVDEDGTVRGVSVVPKPFTQPHPQLFQAFGGSPATLTWCGEENVTPTIFAGPIESLTFLASCYVEGAASRGRTVKPGEGIGVCRGFHIVENGVRRSADSVRAEVYEAYEQHQHIMWHGWYEQFGALQESLRLPGEEGPVPAPGEYLADRLMKSKIWLAGTVDDVKREVEALLQRIPADYLVWLFHWGIMPRDVALRQLELFATEIMPEFGLDASALEQSPAPSE